MSGDGASLSIAMTAQDLPQRRQASLEGGRRPSRPERRPLAFGLSGRGLVRLRDVLPNLICQHLPLCWRGEKVFGTEAAEDASHDGADGLLKSFPPQHRGGAQEGMRQKLGEGGPPPRIPLQAAPKHLHELCLGLSGVALEAMAPRELHREARVAERQQSLHGFHVGKGRMVVHHLVEDDAQAPNVRRSAQLQRPLLHGLRRHVAKRAHGGIAADIRRVIGNLLRNAEVDHLQTTVHEEEIAGLQVRMHNPLAVDHFYSLAHLSPKVLDLG
mmetsp:Transcript_17623/g.38841  ORF Transcript_17623/g.38841 Transcript_17623/m.38841 type:complete len:271 (-) Transcript_17623:1051-1863(-)